MTYILKKDH